jgi:hypothetical protein
MDGDDDNADRSHHSRQEAGADGGNTGELLRPSFSRFIHKRPIGPSDDDQEMGDIGNDRAASTGPQSTPPPPTPALPHPFEKSAEADNWDRTECFSFIKKFSNFVVEKDIEELESDLKEDAPTSFYPAIQEFIGSMQIWLQSGSKDAPNDLAHDFFRRKMAARAREEAVQAQGALL